MSDAHVRTGDFVRFAKIINAVTGAWVPLDSEIHRDDIDWLVALYQETFLLDWKIQQAERAAEPSISRLFYDPELTGRPFGTGVS